MSVSARTTIMIPFHFRDHIENQGKPVESLPSEPQVVTLAREWSKRVIPIIDTQRKAPQTPDLLSSLPEWQNAMEALDQAEVQKSKTRPAESQVRTQLFTEAFKAKLKELNIDERSVAQRFFSEEAKHRLRVVHPLWAPLNELDTDTFNAQHLEEFTAQQTLIIKRMKDLLNTRVMSSGSNADKICFTGLDTGMGGSGMSAAIKRFWSVEGERENQTQTNSSSTHQPLVGRCLTMTVNPEVLTLLSKNSRFEVYGKDKSPIGVVELSRIICTFFNKTNGYLSLTFDLIERVLSKKEKDEDTEKSETKSKEITLSAAHDIIYSLVRATGECSLKPLVKQELEEWQKELPLQVAHC